MNRRDFFKLSGTAAALALIPAAIWQPTKTIFLPPAAGWFQTELKMREMRQYIINRDEIIWRWDAAWRDDFGIAHQISIDQVEVHLEPINLDVAHDQVRKEFERIRLANGFNNSNQIPLDLPRGVDMARHI